MLLLSMVGSHYCQVFEAVFGHDNQLLVDPLCDPISLLDVRDDPLDGESKVARLLHTLNAILPLLADYYHNAAVNHVFHTTNRMNLNTSNPLAHEYGKLRSSRVLQWQ